MDVESGFRKDFSNSNWQTLPFLDWLPDGNEIAVLGSSAATNSNVILAPKPDIWIVKYPSGKPRQLTADPAEFRGISSTQSGDLVSVAIAPTYGGDVVPLSPTDSFQVQHVLPAVPFDCMRGLLAWVSEDKIGCEFPPSTLYSPWQTVTFPEKQGTSGPGTILPIPLRCAQRERKSWAA
jgi:hypothetical protein